MSYVSNFQIGRREANYSVINGGSTDSSKAPIPYFLCLICPWDTNVEQLNCLPTPTIISLRTMLQKLSKCEVKA